MLFKIIKVKKTRITNNTAPHNKIKNKNKTSQHNVRHKLGNYNTRR